MTAFQPISSTALSSVIWEIERGATDVFGLSPFVAPARDVGLVDTGVCKVSRVMTQLRERVIPRVISCLNTTTITLVRRSAVTDDDDPLARRWVVHQQDVEAVVAGPTVENITRGILAASDFEVLVAAKTQGNPLGESDAVRIDGRQFDIVQIQGYPRMPAPVAYRYMVKRSGS